jgi:hypothetical protein
MFLKADTMKTYTLLAFTGLCYWLFQATAAYAGIGFMQKCWTYVEPALNALN